MARNSRAKVKIYNYTMKTIIDEVKRLNNDIDNTITELVKARLAHNDAAVANIHHKMESLMVETQQVCSFIIDNPPSENLDEAADCYLDTISPVGFMEGDYDGSQILDTFRAGANLQKEQFVNKSCQWLKDNLMNFLSITINDREALDVDYNELIYEFKKAMEDK